MTLTATVASANAGTTGTPTGTVTFMEGTTTLGTGTLGANGTATLTTSTLAAGGHTITAVYGGDTTFATSTSSPVTVQVNQPTATQATTTNLTITPANPTVGQAVTLAAAVTGPTGAGTPTGTVTFNDGSTALGTGNLVNGTATLTTSTLAAGSHTINAVYNGDNTFKGSNTSQTITVSQAPPGLVQSLTQLVVSPNPTAGQPVSITAVVIALGNATPSGNVIFNVDGVAQTPIALTPVPGCAWPVLGHLHLLLARGRVSHGHGRLQREHHCRREPGDADDHRQPRHRHRRPAGHDGATVRLPPAADAPGPDLQRVLDPTRALECRQLSGRPGRSQGKAGTADSHPLGDL